MEQIDEILVYEENEFFDIEFPVINIQENDSYLDVSAKGEIKGEILEFTLKVKKEFPAGFVNGQPDESSIINEGAIFNFPEGQTENFANLLSVTYGVESEGPYTNNSLKFTAFPLEETSKEPAEDLLRLKIFYDSDKEDDLFTEYYITLDLKNNAIELNEYHQDYRESILRILKLEQKN